MTKQATRISEVQSVLCEVVAQDFTSLYWVLFLKTYSDSIDHKFSIGFRSRLNFSQSKTCMFLDDRNNFVAFHLWIATLSC